MNGYSAVFCAPVPQSARFVFQHAEKACNSRTTWYDVLVCASKHQEVEMLGIMLIVFCMSAGYVLAYKDED